MVILRSNYTDTPEEFSRLIGLKSWSYEKARNKKVTIVGCGGLGVIISQLLARVGIGRITVIDYDNVERVNLNRLGFEKDAIGKNKAVWVKEVIERSLPVSVEAIQRDVREIEIDEVIRSSDLVITATDNTNSRLLTNYFCVKTNTKMVDVGFTPDGLRGHVHLILPYKTACYACFPLVLPPVEKTTLKDKIDMSVKTGYAISPAPVIAILASLAAMVSFDVLFGIGDPPTYISANLVDMRFTTVNLKRNPECDVCGVDEDG